MDDRPANFVDLTGQTFTRWTVVSESSKRRVRPSGLVVGEVFWNCVCICGEERVILGSNLKYGGSRSCGCLPGDIARARAGKPTLFPLPLPA